jgi:ribosome-associated protein
MEGDDDEATIIPVEPIDPSGDDERGRPSKSQLKRDMQALQALGEQLVALSRERLARIDLPEDLRDAVRDAQRFTKHEARRRQLQYIGRLMRDVDPAPIQAVLDEINGVSAAANARQHALERLRAQLLDDEAVLGDIARQHPGADLQHLRQLRRNALKEQAEHKPPRAFRELFRALRALEEPLHDPDEPGAADE